MTETATLGHQVQVPVTVAMLLESQEEERTRGKIMHQMQNLLRLGVQELNRDV